MRLSEKTIEINYCSQVSSISKSKIFWFGLTQKQEAEAGFDVCTKFKGKLVIFQFKASNLIVGKARRFFLDHLQMTKLKEQIKGYQRAVFYVLPLIGNSYELSQNSDLIQQSRLLDVNRLPYITSPTTKAGLPRKNNKHYLDVYPSHGVLHSEPTRVDLLDPGEFFRRSFSGADGINNLFENNFERFWEFCKILKSNSFAAYVYND